MENDYELTTFNMNLKLKNKAKIFIIKTNQDNEIKLNLGKLINKALEYYLADVKIEGIDLD